MKNPIRAYILAQLSDGREHGANTLYRSANEQEPAMCELTALVADGVVETVGATRYRLPPKGYKPLNVSLVPAQRAKVLALAAHYGVSAGEVARMAIDRMFGFQFGVIDGFDEGRADVIGQNGNDGSHY